MSPKFKAEEGGTSWVVLMVPISNFQGVQELWDRAWFWYTLSTARQHSINTDESLGL